MRQTIKRWLDNLPATENTWFAECYALSLSLASIMGICSLLHHYDGTPNRKWNHVTLNAAVSTITTFSRSMILLAMASCLGQFKWIWFQKQHRPLPDFEFISEASRGPAGSMRLLLRTIWRSVSFRRRHRGHQGYVLLQHVG